MIVNDTEKFEILRKRSKNMPLPLRWKVMKLSVNFWNFLNGERYAVENIYVKEVYPVKISPDSMYTSIYT